MEDLVFITGNQHKADYLARFLGEKIKHHKLDLDELQSLDARAVIEHKARQAYDVLRTPILVEDVTLTFPAMGRLPGTFIKWFQAELGISGLCTLAHNLKHQEAVSVVCFALYDGKHMHFFEGEMRGTMAKKPIGDGGFGFDPGFINEGFDITRGQMTGEQYDETSARLKAIRKLKAFLDKQ